MAPSHLTLADILAGNALRHAQRPAFIEDGRETTHLALWEGSGRLAAGLHAAGVGHGDRIGVLAPNRIEFVLLLCAAARLGAIVCGINWRLSAAEVEQVIAHDQPKLIVADDTLWHLLEPALEAPGRAWTPVALHGPRVGALRFEHLEAMGQPPTAQVLPDEPLLFVHTAWTDGRPRVAMLTHRNLLCQAVQLQATWGLRESDVHLCALPLFHVTALALSLATLLSGGCSVLMPKFDAAAASSAIAEHGVTLLGEFAPMLEGMLSLPDAAEQLGTLRHVCGLDMPATIEKLAQACPQATFWSGFGQSEASGLVTLAPYSEAQGSMGWPLPLTTVEIVGDDDAVVGAEEPGEIAVRGPCVFLGYWQRESDTAWTLRSGRLHTGDSGRIDAAGRLHYLGRLPSKELIKTGGENVYPAEVEAVLKRHPAVADAAVIGVVDPTWGESVRAICVARGQAPDAKALIAFVGDAIAHYKRPRSIVFADALPLLGDGKHDRPAIKARYGVPGA